MFDDLRETAAPLGALAQAVDPDPWESPELRAELEAEYQAVLDAQWELLDPDEGSGEPDGWQPAARPGYADTESSGWLALELNSGTADVAVRSEAALLEAVGGFESGGVVGVG
jgi:hypothetical protein